MKFPTLAAIVAGAAVLLSPQQAQAQYYDEPTVFVGHEAVYDDADDNVTTEPITGTVFRATPSPECNLLQGTGSTDFEGRVGITLERAATSSESDPGNENQEEIYAYPNPGSSTKPVTIEGPSSTKVYDSIGREVPAGTDLAPGVYLARDVESGMREAFTLVERSSYTLRATENAQDSPAPAARSSVSDDCYVTVTLDGELFSEQPLESDGTGRYANQVAGIFYSYQGGDNDDVDITGAVKWPNSFQPGADNFHAIEFDSNGHPVEIPVNYLGQDESGVQTYTITKLSGVELHINAVTETVNNAPPFATGTQLQTEVYANGTIPGVEVRFDGSLVVDGNTASTLVDMPTVTYE